MHSIEAGEESKVLLLLSAPTVCHSIQPPERASLSGQINIPTERPLFACCERGVSNFHFHETELLAEQVVVIARMLIRVLDLGSIVRGDPRGPLGHQGCPVVASGKSSQFKVYFISKFRNAISSLWRLCDHSTEPYMTENLQITTTRTIFLELELTVSYIYSSPVTCFIPPHFSSQD